MRPADLVRRARRISFTVGATALAVILAACGSTLPNHNPTGDAAAPGILPGQVVTEQGHAAVNLYLITFVIAVVVFAIVEGLLITIAIRFRRRKGDDVLPKQTHGNNKLEIIWTLIPAAVVTVLFLVAVNVLMTQTEVLSANPGVTVNVTGFQWQWTFAYPEYVDAKGQAISLTGAGSQGPEMVLPINQPIRFRVTGQDVIHSFYVPQFFYKKDAIPGRINEFDITITDPGTYGGQCAEFCGLGHSTMYFTVRAVTRPEFDQWIQDQETKANASAPPAPSGAASLTIKAVSVTAAFDQKTLSAPADTPLTINFTNADTTVQHNFAIKGANPDSSDWYGTPFAPPGASEVYQAPALKAGTYQFFCQIHPNMQGTLTVGS